MNRETLSLASVGSGWTSAVGGSAWASANVFNARESLEGLAVLQAMAALSLSRTWTAVPSSADLARLEL